MQASGWLQFALYIVALVLIAKPMGLYLLQVLDTNGRTWLDPLLRPIERVTYRVMGGPTHCCGVIQLRTGDTAVSANMAANTMTKLAQTGQVLSWCPSCHVQFSEVMMPAYERSTGSRPFEMTPFMRYLGGRLEDLRPLGLTPTQKNFRKFMREKQRRERRANR